MTDISYWQKKFESYLSKIPSSDGSHDLSHLQRVWNLANKFSTNKDDKLVILAACYFHDFVCYPKNHSRRSHSSRMAAKKCQNVLIDMGFPLEKLDHVCHCIEAHSFSANIEPQTNEAKIVQDADRIEALGAIGLARTFYIAGQMGSKLFNPEDPFAKNRALNDRLYALDHFETKLLGLPSTMKTSEGQREAKTRADIMKRFLRDLKVEIADLNSI